MAEHVTAYMLIVTKVGEERIVKGRIEELARREGGIERTEVKLVFGEYDLIVIVKASSISALDDFVSKVRKLEGVERTVTLIGV